MRPYSLAEQEKKSGPEHDKREGKAGLKQRECGKGLKAANRRPLSYETPPKRISQVASICRNSWAWMMDAKGGQEGGAYDDVGRYKGGTLSSGNRDPVSEEEGTSNQSHGVFNDSPAWWEKGRERKFGACCVKHLRDLATATQVCGEVGYRRTRPCAVS